jgi:hypothetical protein
MSYLMIPRSRPMSGLGCLCGAMGSNGDAAAVATTAATSVFTFTNMSRVAMAVAAVAILWRIFARRSPMQANMLTPWADIGPLFAKSLALGPAFALTHYL